MRECGAKRVAPKVRARFFVIISHLRRVRKKIARIFIIFTM